MGKGVAVGDGDLLEAHHLGHIKERKKISDAEFLKELRRSHLCGELGEQRAGTENSADRGIVERDDDEFLRPVSFGKYCKLRRERGAELLRGHPGNKPNT